MLPSSRTTKRTPPVASSCVRWPLGSRRNPPRIRRLWYEFLEDRRLLSGTHQLPELPGMRLADPAASRFDGAGHLPRLRRRDGRHLRRPPPGRMHRPDHTLIASGYSRVRLLFPTAIARRPSAYRGGDIPKARSGNHPAHTTPDFSPGLLTNQDLRRQILFVFQP